MSEKQPVESSETGSTPGATTDTAGAPATGTADAPGQQAGEERTAAEQAEHPATGTEDGEDIETLRQRLEEAEARAQEYWDKLLRAEAEKENIRKRAERDAASARRQALEKFAAEILSVRDSLELGQEAASQEEADLDKIREGTDLTLKMLTQAMEKFSIEELNPLGEKFDPELHQAMSMQDAEGQEPNTVTAVVQKGYRLGERLLRPALVMVAK